MEPILSHLLQMRGLKLLSVLIPLIWSMSHLLQMRGLKQTTGKTPRRQNVASFTDAWIETYSGGAILSHDLSHLLQMRGLKR